MEEDAKQKCKTMDYMLDVFGKKWATRIFLRLLYAEKKMGFNEILRATPGINPKMLSDRLKSLEKHGLIKREVETSPIRTYYSLTEAGRDFKGAIEAMLAWNKKWNVITHRENP